MVAAAFSYLRVHSFNEAVRALSDQDEDAKLPAGGQSLVPMLKLRLAMPSVLTDANAIADAIGCRPTALPMTAERVLALLDQQRAATWPAPQ